MPSVGVDGVEDLGGGVVDLGGIGAEDDLGRAFDVAVGGVGTGGTRAAVRRSLATGVVSRARGTGGGCRSPPDSSADAIRSRSWRGSR